MVVVLKLVFESPRLDSRLQDFHSLGKRRQSCLIREEGVGVRIGQWKQFSVCRHFSYMHLQWDSFLTLCVFLYFHSSSGAMHNLTECVVVEVNVISLWFKILLECQNNFFNHGIIFCLHDLKHPFQGNNYILIHIPVIHKIVKKMIPDWIIDGAVGRGKTENQEVWGPSLVRFNKGIFLQPCRRISWNQVHNYDICFFLLPIQPLWEVNDAYMANNVPRMTTLIGGPEDSRVTPVLFSERYSKREACKCGVHFTFWRVLSQSWACCSYLTSTVHKWGGGG